MYFVGREKESRKIIRFLQHGRNVILTGKFGIGRTSLIKHVAVLTKDRWRFIFLDFSQTPGKVTTQLLVELLPEKRKGKDHYIRYKSGRFLIVSKELKDKRNHVLVLDNILKLTPQKLQLIRYLVQESKFQFIAIIESFLPKEDWFLLRTALLPAEVIILPYLSGESTKELLRHLAERYTFNWSEQRLSTLVSINRGYPLGVQEIIQRELDARKKDAFRK